MWQARVGQIDMLLTFFVALTTYCWVRAFLEERRRLYPAGFFVAGLGTITKGPVALLPILLSFAAFFLATGRRDELRRMGIVRGLAAWAAVVLTWLLPAGLIATGADGSGYLHELLVTQNLTRYYTGRFAENLTTEDDLQRFLDRPDRGLFIEKEKLKWHEGPLAAVEVARGADPKNGYVLFASTRGNRSGWWKSGCGPGRGDHAR